MHFSRVRKADVRLPSVCRLVRRGGNGRTARFPCGGPEEHSVFGGHHCEAFQRQMAAAEQLDLFSVSPGPDGRNSPDCSTGPVIACNTLDDDRLLAATLNAGIRDTVALVAEAGRRRLAAAIPVLDALCRRFTGYGADRIVPEQAAALGAIALIGGRDAAQTLVRLIAMRIVQGPCLRQAVAAAARLGATFRPAPSSSCCGMTIHRFAPMRAGALASGRRLCPSYAISSMTCILMPERPPLALSRAWAGMRFADFLSVIFGKNRPRNLSMPSLA